jgi:hypothetical protein
MGNLKKMKKFVPADGNFNVGEIKVQSGSKDKGSNKKGETLNSDMKDITPSRDEMLYENTNTFNDMSESNIVDFRGVAITDFDNIEINGVKDKETIDVNTNDGLIQISTQIQIRIQTMDLLPLLLLMKIFSKV